MTWQPTNQYTDRLNTAEAAAEARRSLRRDREQAERDALLVAGQLQDGLDLFADQLTALGVASRHDIEVTGIAAALRRLIRRIDPDWGGTDDYGPRIAG